MSGHQEGRKGVLSQGDGFMVLDALVYSLKGFHLKTEDLSHHGRVIQQSGFIGVGTKGTLVSLLQMLYSEYMIHMAMGIELSCDVQSLRADIPVKGPDLFRGIESRVNNQALPSLITYNVGIDLEGVEY